MAGWPLRQIKSLPSARVPTTTEQRCSYLQSALSQVEELKLRQSWTVLPLMMADEAKRCCDNHGQKAFQNPLAQFFEMVHQRHLDLIGQVGIIGTTSDPNGWRWLKNWTVWAVGHAR